MKCERYQTWALLHDSGELGARRARQLARHAGDCPACRGFQQGLGDARAAMAALPVAPVDRVTLSVLQDVALHHRRRSAQRMVRQRAVAWAMAASIFIGALIGVSALLSGGSITPSGATAGLASPDWTEWAAADPLDVSLDVFAEQLSLSNSDEEAAWASTPAASEDSEDLAQELLQLWEA